MLNHREPDVNTVWTKVFATAIIILISYWSCSCTIFGTEQAQKLSDEMQVNEKRTEKRIQDLELQMANTLDVTKQETDNRVQDLTNTAETLYQQLTEIKNERNEYITQSSWEQYQTEIRQEIKTTIQQTYKISSQEQTNSTGLIIGLSIVAGVLILVFGLLLMVFLFKILKALVAGDNKIFGK